MEIWKVETSFLIMSSTYTIAHYLCHTDAFEHFSDVLLSQGAWSISSTPASKPDHVHVEVISDTTFDHSLALTQKHVTDDTWLRHATCTLSESLVVGQFEIIPSTQKIRGLGRPLFVDATAVFGDGQHHSTRLCVDMLETYSRSYTPERVLDIGTGSGILAMMAKCFFPEATVVGIDNDPIAVTRATENALTNTLACHFYLADIRETTPEPASLILINCQTEIQLVLANSLPYFMTKNGHVIVSGVWESWENIVLKAYLDAGFLLLSNCKQDGWCGFVFEWPS